MAQTISEDTREEILAGFLAPVNTLETLLKDIPDQLLDCSAAPGEWTLRQIVFHIADETFWSVAIKNAIATPGAIVRFEGFPGNEAWADGLGFDRRPVTTALFVFRALRQEIVELVQTCATDWEKCTITPVDENGKALPAMHLGQILPMLTGHVEEHIQTVKTILQQNA